MPFSSPATFTCNSVHKHLTCIQPPLSPLTSASRLPLPLLKHLSHACHWLFTNRHSSNTPSTSSAQSYRSASVVGPNGLKSINTTRSVRAVRYTSKTSAKQLSTNGLDVDEFQTGMDAKWVRIDPPHKNEVNWQCDNEAENRIRSPSVPHAVSAQWTVRQSIGWISLSKDPVCQ